MKNKRSKIIIGAVLAIYVLAPLWLYINYMSRDVYVKKAIGRLEGDKFYNFGGTCIWKLEGYDEQDVIYETALMWQAAYKRKEVQ